MSSTIYGNLTKNGIYVSDMVWNNNDIVYRNPSHEGFFARLTGWFGDETMKDEAKPAIAAFHESNPFDAVYAMKLNGDFEKYLTPDGTDTNKDFGKALEQFWEKFDSGLTK